MAKQTKKKSDSIEYEKRIRIIQDWIIEDWPYTDIVTQVKQKWWVLDRQAKRYIKEARERWVEEEDVEVEQRRAMKIVGLKKLKRSLKEIYKGTPSGIMAVVRVEKEIIKLEGLPLPTKIAIGGDPQNPTPVPVEIKHDLSKLSDIELETIINLSKKAVKQ